METEATIERSAGRVRGLAHGCLFFVGFGALWLLTGWNAVAPGGWRVRSVICFVSLALVALALQMLHRAKRLPELAGRGEEMLRARRMFAAVNIIQWVSIVTASVILSVLHLPEYIVSAIAIVVALHLFPLASSFHYRQHAVTGALVLAWSLGCLATMRREHVSGVTAVGTGVVLLVSAAATLWRSFGRVAG